MNTDQQSSTQASPEPERPPGPMRPLPRISGSAMPTGVHMSSGVVSTSSSLALLTTGLSIALMGSAAMVLTYLVTWAAEQLWSVPLVPTLLQLTRLPDNGEGAAIEVGLNVLMLLCFLTVMRLSPLAGYHAAEHKVIAAIERFGEPTLEHARAMPRAHRRCGSNLLAGVLPLLLVGIPLFRYFPMAAGIIIILGWMFRFQTGYLVQQIFATKEPTEKQLQAGLRAGQEIMAAWRAEPFKRVPPLVSLWRRGFVQMFAGVLAGMWLIQLAYDHLHLFLDF